MQKKKKFVEHFCLQTSKLCAIVMLYILLLCVGIVWYQNKNVSAKTTDMASDSLILVNTLPIRALQDTQPWVSTEVEVMDVPAADFLQNKDKLEDMQKEVLKKQKLWKAERKRLRAIRRKKKRLLRIKKLCGVKVDDASRKILERIVEAEAGGEDLRGKIMVANVVLNRVRSKRFPSTVKKVVFAHRQFSPLSDGRYWKVTVSKHTKKAVSMALHGKDYSEGAFYFMERRYASASNVRWFDTALTKVASHGVHEFYK